MTLDIEKIKAALKVAQTVLHDLRDNWRVIAGAESIQQYIRAQNARGIVLEALAALDAYDPDEITVKALNEADMAIINKRDEIVRAANDGQYQDADDILKAYADAIRREQRKLFAPVLQTCLESMRERAKVVASLGGIATSKWDDDERMIDAAIMNTGKE